MTTIERSDIRTVEDVLARIRDIAPLLQKNAASSETERRVSDETITALKEAGVFRLAVPRRYGGLETDLRTMLEVSAAIAEADGGPSWVATLSSINSWAAGLATVKTQDEVWAGGPDTILAGVIAPTGKARKVPGGYQVSGSWAYSSASLHAEWASGGVHLVDDGDQIIDQGMVYLPKADFRIEDTWYVTGMRSSGSNTIVTEDVFVPEHRYTSMIPMVTGQYISDHPDAPLYRSALAPMLVMVLVGPQLGFGRAALDLVIRKGATKSLAYTVFEQNRDSVAFQLLVAEAAMKVETAHLHAFRAAEDVMRYADAGEFPDVTARARVRGDAAIALRSINDAINTLLNANGAGSFAEVNAMQRIWRDSNVAARHAVMLPQVSMETYGKALLGIQEHITPIL
ncbi:acyl-CoA dehydrogenase family protein [Mycolicibacterium komossense]|uniref:Acyl-CoA dehydrogenase family protein n=1 Tax=Mycolicibacterium komossense TaxID=1779 RepID=A0ABT3CEY9_9MYCO|nr:acyl-CoA dehydrogenase family protein [Mycolicibacterium komossense]MCV7228043.1 acyl-CoA dehydrogenase family protein [Mycolicibacterium komossense]